MARSPLTILAILCAFSSRNAGLSAQPLPAPPARATQPTHNNAEESSSASVAPQLLLLRNGETLVGEITLEQGRYVVHLASGQVRIKADDVRAVCADLEAAYDLLAQQVDRNDLAGRLRLAQWCLKQALHPQAAAQLDAAQRLAPGDPQAALLRRQLDLLAERSADRPASRAAAAAASSLTESSLDGLPPGVMESFVATVQPLLLNQCASGACHGARSEQSWKMVRVSQGRARSRRLSLRNLQACLSMVDASSPHGSPLLARATAAHATGAAPLRDAQYQLLLEWVLRAATTPTPLSPLTVQHAAAAPPGLVRPHTTPERSTSSARTSATLAGLRTPAAPSEPHHSNASDAPSGDPLDPAAFNRRFAKPAAVDSNSAGSNSEDRAPADGDLAADADAGVDATAEADDHE